ncbi:hypothetical protein [Desulfonatronum thiosulfatophilum]|nr:hypothetical protein [Desulfonatronum thiosulfatophilum]
MKFTPAPGIVVHAKYDNGQPMSEAQITVYAPDNPARPWLVGQADPEGRFAFVPDPAIPGTWAVQARQAGHGAIIHISTDETRSDIPDPMVNTTTPQFNQTSQGITPIQKGLMAGAIVWGCVGTALFFSCRRRT